MSIRTNPMKAVTVLLKRLMSLEQRADLKRLMSELFKIRDLFFIVKENKEELLDTLTVVDGYLRDSNIRKLMEEEEEICRRLRKSTRKLLPGDHATQSSNTEAAKSSEETIFGGEKLKVHGELRSEEFKVHYDELDRLHKRFFMSLLLFPENAVIKMSTIHFWWAAVVGYFMIGQFNFVFEYLFNRKLIVPHGNGKCPIVKKFKINPCVRHELMRPFLQNDYEELCGVYSELIASSRHPNTSHRSLMLNKKQVDLIDSFGYKSDHWRAVFNVSASYLNIESEWMAKMKHLEVLQLGRWLHDSPEHHIEVGSEEFFKELKHHTRLKYVSLRGISRIFGLPPSIFQLENLAFLDLKACHNLETLPNDISSLKKLRHLNLSQCYLLERMPKGIEKLSNLEVLKGFVIGDSSKTHPYKIADLENLKNLEQLSLHIGSGALTQTDLKFELQNLETLKISWGVTSYKDIQIKLPLNLKKLHLEGFPEQNIPEWLKPNKLPKALIELCITGGKLKSMDLREYADVPADSPCTLKIVRLKYLQHLNLEPTNLWDLPPPYLCNLLPPLDYIEIKQVRNIRYREWYRKENAESESTGMSFSYLQNSIYMSKT